MSINFFKKRQIRLINDNQYIKYNKLLVIYEFNFLKIINL